MRGFGARSDIFRAHEKRFSKKVIFRSIFQKIKNICDYSYNFSEIFKNSKNIVTIVTIFPRNSKICLTIVTIFPKKAKKYKNHVTIVTIFQGNLKNCVTIVTFLRDFKNFGKIVTIVTHIFDFF